MKKIALIGPVYPYKTGLSYYVGLLYRQLRMHYEVLLYSYSMQYPRLLYKKEQKDYSDDTVVIDEAEYILNSANPVSWIRLVKRLKKEEHELLILQWLHPYFAPCYWFITKHLKKIKVIYICHNALPHERFPLDKWLTRVTLAKADSIIAHSNSDADILKGMLPKIPIKVNPHPAYNFFKIQNMTMEEGRKQLGIQQDAKVLLFFGLVREYKGLRHLIGAMPKIIQEYRDIKLLIVGDFGKEENRVLYEAMIRELGLADNIDIYGGHIPIPEVEKFFVACDMVVLPYESATQSGVIQVAYSFQKPVLATNVGGLPDVVSDKKTGYIVEPRQPNQIAEAVLDFYENAKIQDFKKHIAEESYRFSWERMEETIKELT